MKTKNKKKIIPHRGEGMYIKPYKGKGMYVKPGILNTGKGMYIKPQAWERVKSSDASIGERAAAYAIVNAMKAKAKLGMGLNLNKKYGQLSDIKSCEKNTLLQRSVHAKRVKKSKKK